VRLSRRGTRILLVVAALVAAFVPAALLLRWVLLGGLEKDLVPLTVEPRATWRAVRGPLMQTRWKQDGPYAALSPRQELLGCWSVAFAQVLAYHRLEPRGRVSYRTRGGLAIDRVLDRHVEWAKVAPAVQADSSPDTARETATYLYDAAVVVRKDFGRDEYMDIARIPAEVSEHYGARVERVASGIPETIKSELRAGRPLVAYFDNILGIPVVRNGHAAVFDGIAEDAGRLLVHVNFGWGGASDGWYAFDVLAKARELLYVFRVVS
jgi:hypothetical protein